jgi:hypothetical protein
MLSSQIMSSDHSEQVSSSFFVSTTSTTAYAATMPRGQQASTPSSPAPEETAHGSTTAAERSEQEMLPADFSPHHHSVVCGRGKKCINAPGNQRLKIISRKFLQKYAQIKCKKSKAAIVADIIDLVRSECPNGGQGAFVRFHQNNWWEVDELGARQKVTTIMRDGLHNIYKSSSKSKVTMRRTQKVLEHRHQESVHTSTILEPVTLNSVITNKIYQQNTQDRLQRTVPNIICQQKALEEGILHESLLEPIALHVPSSTFFDQQEHQEKSPPATYMHKAPKNSSSGLQGTMQRHRKLLGHLEQAERALEMFEYLEPTPSMHVISTPSFNCRSNEQDGTISVVTPPPAFWSRTVLAPFFRRDENHYDEGYYASSCSSSVTRDDDVATPAPSHAPFPVDASFDIDNIFD